MRLFGLFIVCALVFAGTNVNASQNGKVQVAQANGKKATVDELVALADSGNSLAQLQMGLILRSGLDGVAKDPKRAFGYLLKAAEQAQWNSQYMIADMYATGWGVGKDPVSALKWASIAAGRGSKAGLSIATKLRGTLDKKSIKKAQSIADKWTKVTLIDGRPAGKYSVSCRVLRIQIEQAKNFMDNVKTKNDTKRFKSSIGIKKWSSLLIIYPSGIVALDDISRRYKGLRKVRSRKGCS